MERFTQFPLIRFALRYKRTIAAIVIVLTIALLAVYLSHHPDDIRRVIQTPPYILLTLGVLYLCVIGTNAVITHATVRLCRKELPVKSSIFLTVYSTIVNFFGPLQSGPGVRAVYLKTKVGLRIRDYTLATFFYFVSFAALNVSFLFVNTVPFLTVIGILVSIALILFGVKRFHFRDRSSYVFMIYLVTAVQVILMSTVFFVELWAVKSPVSYTQALAYGASANLSLFVSITPGAIGIREAFILFATSLHHVPLASVVAAGVLDRAFYVLLLVVLFVVSTSFHVKDSLFRKKPS